MFRRGNKDAMINLPNSDPKPSAEALLQAVEEWCPAEYQADLLKLARELTASAPANAHAATGYDPHEMFDHFIAEAIDKSPEPLRRLGEWLAVHLDEDEWKTAERMLLGAATAWSAPAATGDAVRALVAKWRNKDTDFAAWRFAADELEAALSADKASGEVGR